MRCFIPPYISGIHIIIQYMHIYRKMGKEGEVDSRENVGSQIF